MKSVSVLRNSVVKNRDAGPKTLDRQARVQDDAPAAGEMISLLACLETDNKKLWQSVLELSIETAVLRRALKTEKSRRRVKPAAGRPPHSRITASAVPAQASEGELRVLPFGR
jgi:hypothetical protein